MLPSTHATIYLFYHLSYSTIYLFYHLRLAPLRDEGKKPSTLCKMDVVYMDEYSHHIRRVLRVPLEVYLHPFTKAVSYVCKAWVGFMII
jgi:hypothetical protein